MSVQTLNTEPGRAEANAAVKSETAPAVAIVTSPLPAPEEISRMVSETFDSFEVAIENLRRIGATAQDMGDTIASKCDVAGMSMLKQARGTLDSFESFASIMGSLSVTVDDVTSTLSKAVNSQRPAAADAFGIGANNGRGGDR
jgi:methyl-accepting chemotaxis protein